VRLPSADGLELAVWIAFAAIVLGTLIAACPFCAPRQPIIYSECKDACAELGIESFTPGRYTMAFACVCRRPAPRELKP
jgi:hypothetical protein